MIHSFLSDSTEWVMGTDRKAICSSPPAISPGARYRLSVAHVASSVLLFFVLDTTIIGVGVQKKGRSNQYILRVHVNVNIYI